MSDSADKSQASPAVHAVLLGLFTALFALRVAAQLVQYVSPTRFLPPFEAWQGSGLAYSVLLASQLTILAAMVWGTGAVRRRPRVRKNAGRWLIALGAVYFGSMAVRLVLGLTVLSDLAWFAKPLPALFHLVLASYVLTLGHYHSWHDQCIKRGGYFPAIADRSLVYEVAMKGVRQGDDTDWQTLLKRHDAAVSNFENASKALRAALARYPHSAEFLDLIVVEERARESVLRLRARLIKLWHDNIDDTIPLRILKPDHICDHDGPTEGFVDETGHEAIAGIYPTCSQCGMLQVPGADLARASTDDAPRLSY